MGEIRGDRGSESPRIVLVAAMRNEGPFILEWVAFHLSIGFTHIVIATNDCLDGSPELVRRLGDVAPVTHLPNPVGPGDLPQIAAYARAARLPVVREAEWAMVLDADEFLNIHAGDGTVADLLAAVPEATAFVLNWRLFGSAGHSKWSPEWVTERFTRAAVAADPVNLSFKTLFSKADAYRCPLSPHGPSRAFADRVPELHYVNGAGERLPQHFATTETFLQSEPHQVSWALAQVNHYNTRSCEDYLVKHRRGGGVTREWDRDWNWRAFDKNDESDGSILARLPPAKSLCADLARRPSVAQADARCRALYGAHVVALARPRPRGADRPRPPAREARRVAPKFREGFRWASSGPLLPRDSSQPRSSRR